MRIHEAGILDPAVTMQDAILLPTAPAPRVSVIIPAAARADLLRACLRSLALQAPPGISFETIVVLSPGAHAAGLESAVDGVRWLTPRVNLGLAGAGNLGRTVARGEYLVLLHDDAEVQAGWLEALVAAAEEHPEAGAIGSQVLHPNGTLQSAGWVLWRNGLTSPPWVGDPAPPPSGFGRRRAVDYCGTCSVLVRAASWDRIGGLEERFFPAYYVDVDLCTALYQQGQVVLYEPASRILHHRGASSSRRLREFVTVRNRQIFVDKWRGALAAYEPAAPTDPLAIERALQRTERLANELAHSESTTARPAPLPSAPRESAANPELEREERAVQLDLAVRRAFAEHLETKLEEASDARTEALQRIAVLEEAAVTLAAIQHSRTWKLYQRALPLLSWLRRR